MKITRLKSQVDIEFITITAILLLMFLILLAFSIKRQQDAGNVKDFIEKRGECLKLSNLISSVFNDGSGTAVKTNTKYAILVYNDSITVRNVENVTVEQTKIAILASEAGESTQNFYNTATEMLAPKWYKTCFSDLGGGSGCQQWQSAGITVQTWNNITKTLDNLIQDIDNYNVIYLEDAHIKYDATYDGLTYLQILQDWISKGNILIMAEHVMCREQSSGTYSSTSYMCNPPGSYANDIWTIFSNKIHQRSGSYGHDITVVIEPPQEFFPNLHQGDKYDLEENSYIELNEEYRKAYSGSFIGTYSDSGGSYTKTYNDDNSYWYFGSDNNYYNITGYAEITYNISSLGVSKGDITNLNFSIKYCHDGSTGVASCDGDAAEGKVQGNQSVEIYNYSRSVWQSIGNLRTNDNGYEILSSFVPSGNLGDFVSNTKLIRIRYEMDYYNGNNQDSYLVIDSAILNVTARNMKTPIIVAKYDADLQPAILYWDYGEGKVFYFADFQVRYWQQSTYSQILSELIERVAYLFMTPKGNEITCNFIGNVYSIGQFTGNVEINNTNDKVFITQYV